MKDKLRTFLKGNPSLIDIQQYCRLIAKEELKKKLSDEKAWGIGEILCELVYFPIHTEIQKKEDNKSLKTDRGWIVPACGTLAAFGIGWFIGKITDSYLWSSVAGGAFVGAGLFLISVNGNKNSHGKASQKVLSSVDEIYEMILKFVEIVEKIALYKPDKEVPEVYPLEGKYYTVLEFFANSYVECQSYGEECSRYFQKQINRTLKLSGYEFVDYSEEVRDLYQIYESQEEKPTINVVQYAIKNRKTEETIRKGIVYIKE